MSLKNYFPPSNHEAKREFDAWLDNIYYRKDFFSYIAHVKSGRYFHTSPSFESMTGYTIKQFEEEGVDFFVRRVPQEDTLRVIAVQAEFFKKALAPGFNSSLSHISEMIAHLMRPNGDYIVWVGLSVPLAYLPTGEYDFALIIAYPRNKDELEEAKVNTETRALLSQTKVLYDQIYPSRKKDTAQLIETVEIFSGKNPQHLLTSREKKVLYRIAKGASSKEIAAELVISENTVESHRKNMLQKFKAKNVAELIKKTSKLYWLE